MIPLIEEYKKDDVNGDIIEKEVYSFNVMVLGSSEKDRK